MGRLLRSLAIAVIALGAAGCIIARTDRHGNITRLSVVIPHGHVHNDHCGHYHWRGGWYVLSGHVHGPACGHHFRGGIWIDID